MPHVGGGSHSGGFHSSSSGTTSIPRTDVYGHTHSRYYRRPGYYVHGIYVPYSRVHRTFHAIKGIFFFIIFGLAFVVGAILAFVNPKSDSKLEDYALYYYSVTYDPGQSYESNIFIQIVAYDNLTEIDYLPIVGDNVARTVDEMFGNQYTLFGGAFSNNLSKNENKVNNLYSALADSLEETNNAISNKYYTLNHYDTKVSNRTNFELGDQTKLLAEMDRFYNLTGYNISIDISEYGDVYKPEVGLCVGLGVIGLAFIAVSTFSIIKTVKAVKVINEEDKKGNLEKYFEGEVSYKEHTKRHSMDDPYKYSKKEYDDLKKEFETNPKDYEINQDDYK